MSTSNGALALIFSASRTLAPVSILARISSTPMRPEANTSPLRNTFGTDITWRLSTSSSNSAPSMATWRMRGLSTAIRFSACTTSGQFWHDSEK
jgi:hypothetical protein